MITGGTIFTASLAAFAFSRMRFAGRELLMWILLAGLIVPFQALIVPLFAEIKSFGLADTYWGVILPQIAAPIAVLVYKRAFDAVPRELEESALVDGASMWRDVPADLDAAVARDHRGGGHLHVRAGVEQLLLAVRDHERRGALHHPRRPRDGETAYGALYAQTMAMAIMGALPLLIAFLFFQRQIVQGIANTGLKG